MGSPSVIDIEAVLRPVSAVEPAGPALSAGALPGQLSVRQVRDARSIAVKAERALGHASSTSNSIGIPGSSFASPAWKSVCDQAIALLAQSKDLWVTAWLTEALLRQHGFAGLRDGFKVARELCERFWDGLHPQDMSERFEQFKGLNGVERDGPLIQAIMLTPISAPSSVRPVSFSDHEVAVELQGKSAEIQSARIEHGVVTIDAFEQSIAESSTEYLRDVLEDLTEALEEFGSLNALLAEKIKDRHQRPPSSKIRETLANCIDLYRSLTRERLAKDAGDGISEGVNLNAATQLAQGDGGLVPPQSQSHNRASDQRHSEMNHMSPSTQQESLADIPPRDEALDCLKRAADYFRMAEPHSPISYSIEQALRWAGTPLPKLLEELVSDQSAREEIFRRTGILPRIEGKDGEAQG